MLQFRRKKAEKAREIDTQNLPRHIGIIMDGNGRWAQQRSLPRSAGHAQGAETFRTIAGKPYRLLPLPMPRAIYDDDERLPATYANFLIINGAVLVPTYNQPDLDRQALETISKAFPDREIVGIDARVAVRQHGSLHCLTMQFPVE